MRAASTAPVADTSDLVGPGEDMTARKGQILYRQGDHVDRLLFLTSGRVQLFRSLLSGKRLDLDTIEPGSFFGSTSMFGVTRGDATAEAIEHSRIRMMRAADVDCLVREQPGVALWIMEALSRRLALAEVRLEEMAYRGVPARVAAVLVRLTEGRDNHPIPITHQELGNMVGALRETVTKVLAEFQAAGVVELGRGRIVVRDIGSLRVRLDD